MPLLSFKIAFNKTLSIRFLLKAILNKNKLIQNTLDDYVIRIKQQQ